MRIASSIVVITLCAGLLTACSKQESQTPEPPKETPQAAVDVPKSVEAAAPAVQEAASPVASNAQSLIDKAKSLVANEKYQDAANVLKQLASIKLTPEQQKIVDDLMDRIHEAIGGQAATDATQKAKSAVGGMLGGNQ